MELLHIKKKYEFDEVARDNAQYESNIIKETNDTWVHLRKIEIGHSRQQKLFKFHSLI